MKTTTKAFLLPFSWFSCVDLKPLVSSSDCLGTRIFFVASDFEVALVWFFGVAPLLGLFGD